ncbi:MAG: homogentisate 1,2-dioxygenase [Cyanobacteria bacterium SZAS LIN-2]|nr:homogentisate 1,2-dioxygenase [Cyanobacteria bacterium SZAS LIN-2]
MTVKTVATKLSYQSGFGNYVISEAIPDCVPRNQNSPQKINYGLYAEQLSGSSFVMTRAANKRSWLYRILPSVKHGAFQRIDNKNLKSRPFLDAPATPDQLRWDAFGAPPKGEKLDFIDGLFTIAGNGDSASVRGSAVHIYRVSASMTDRFFYNADGEFLIVPEKEGLILRTEFGIMEIAPGEIAVIPRGVKFQVRLPEDVQFARGYVLENYGEPLRLPDLGPIGANGLANPRDFLVPQAAFEDLKGDFRLTTKFQGNLFDAAIDHSPLNVVGWHGNYYPYKYDLSLFNVINTVSFDHPDPSIFTVLTSPSEVPGLSNIDFVIFPPRWMVAENTFRPPYYHRNLMSEYMGLIFGVYDAKAEGFVPGGGSLHNSMSAHGPDAETFDKASNVELKPVYQGGTLAFMFESSLVYTPTAQALKCTELQEDYRACWDALPNNFQGPAAK